MLEEIELESGWLAETIETISQDVERWPAAMKSLLDIIEQEDA